MSLDCDQGVELAPDFARIKNELTLWAKLKHFPLKVTFELTPLCNFRCPMCYVHLDAAGMAKQGKLMSAEKWLEIGRQSRDMGALFVTLTGGEPFLHPEFWTIYNGLTEMGLLVLIFSNGYLIDEEVVEKLKANPPHNIKLSIYGASNETYETMCGVKNGFTRVSHAIDLLKEAELPFYCSCTVVHENFKDGLELYRFAAEKQIRFFHTMAVAQSARGSLADPLSSRTTTDEENWTLEGLEDLKRKQDLRPFAFCGGYKTSYFMTWHGHMQFCGFAPRPSVQIRDTVDVQTAWDQLHEMTDAIKTPEECATCEHAEFCMRCPGLLAAESGGYPDRTSKAFCEPAAERHRLYDELKAKALAEASDSAD